MKRHEKLIAKFITKTPLHCIYIAGPIKRRPVKVAIDRLTVEPREGNKFIFWRRFWVASEGHARAVVDTFATASWADRGQTPSWYWLDVDICEERLREIARDRGIPLTANADVVRRAGEVVKRYDDALTAMTRRGEMKPLNRAYKAHRASESNLGRKALCYEDWRDQRLNSVFEAIAAQIFRGHVQPIVKPTEKDIAPLEYSPSNNGCDT